MINNRKLGSTTIEVGEISFGAASIGNLFNPVTNEESEQAVEAAWRRGIRYFDTAPHYGAGLSERRLGLALHGREAEGRILSTKVGRLLEPLASGSQLKQDEFVDEPRFGRRYDYSYDGVMRSYEDSCQRLGTHQIDILLMHDIGRLTHGDANDELFRIAMDGGYKAMAELREQGLVKAIGLGVNEWQVCDATLQHADFDCFMVANALTLLDNDLVDSFLAKCSANNTSIIAAAPFSSGILAKGSAGGGHYFYGDAPKEIIARVIRMEAVCDAYAIPLGAAALQYPLLFPVVSTVLIGMSRAARIETNLDWYELEIPNDFWVSLRDEGLIHPATPI